METCKCGITLREFWVWRDSYDRLHASSFPPTVGLVRALLASTARDALLPVTENQAPKHDVRDLDDAGLTWEGRCATAIGAAAV